MQLRLGQARIGGTRAVIIIKGRDLYRLGDGAPQTTAELIVGVSGRSGLSLRLAEIENRFGLVALGTDEDIRAGRVELLKPIDPQEVWAVGVTYRRQALEHDIDIETRTGKTEALYRYVYDSPRAEVFFKGFSRTCRGPGEPITLRADSDQVLPEAEMVLVLGADGLPIGYTLGNDLTAWDIERECPLFLNQAKIWDGSGALGPFIVPADIFGDPYSCTVTCKVLRGDNMVIDSTGSTNELKRSLEELCFYLNFNNPVPAGTVLFTGTACVIPHDFSLEEGDITVVSVSGLGELRNPVVRHQRPRRNFSTRSIGASRS